ncbi:Peptidoglycan-binding domain 1 protein [Paenibacillus curdlanolyticus YK9]|uniref:Peptidoglycan-binding domain 1 protein n=1 Tax=Paenibacillus curdlanolyticus YK9 TaxID=717606 RepID=E0I5R0_9BACL|nr:phage tail tip lysozyme [Paenibacillus curdlanolyticus]EFM12302.1 Peptidoglycan-binding domain 1 protein [Paenibacillus curdlanolyticus YK9]
MTTAVATRPIIKRGSKGEEVTRIQTLLNKAGFPPGTVDSDFGSNTEEAVRNFQKANHLEVDGVVGKDTWALLLKYAGGPDSDASTRRVYTVQKGDTFWSIGLKFDVSDVAIQKANPHLIPTNLQVGTQVVIPNAGGSDNDTPTRRVYTVQKGDTFWSIGLKFGVSDVAIQEANPHLIPTNLQVGTQVMIPDVGGSDHHTPPSGDHTVYAKPCSRHGDLTDAQMKANVLYINQYMTANGWTKHAIAGLLGNMEQESGFNPGVWQFNQKTSGGYGLVQWTPARDKILRWMGNLSAEQADHMARNDPKKLMDKQLEYLLIELKETRLDKREWIPTTNYNSPYVMTPEEYIHSDKNVGDLALVFHGSFERSRDSWTFKQARINNAKKWYNFLV